jgi:hypothetical protein
MCCINQTLTTELMYTKLTCLVRTPVNCPSWNVFRSIEEKEKIGEIFSFNYELNERTDVLVGK